MGDHTLRNRMVDGCVSNVFQNVNNAMVGPRQHTTQAGLCTSRTVRADGTAALNLSFGASQPVPNTVSRNITSSPVVTVPSREAEEPKGRLPKGFRTPSTVCSVTGLS